MAQDYQENKLLQWEKLINDADTCGKTKKEWCADHGIRERQLYYWQRKVRRSVIEKAQPETGENLPAFAILTPPTAEHPYIETAGPDGNPCQAEDGFFHPVVLCTGDFRIMIGDSVSEQALTTILRAIRNA